MCSATPVEVLLLMELLGAHLTHLDALVNFSLTTLQFDNTLLHLLPLSFQDLVLLIELQALVQLFVQIVGQLLDCLLVLMDGSLGHHGELDFLSISSGLHIYHLSDHVTEIISLLEYHFEALVQVSFLILDG